jgi:DNA-binding NarL/FixJ family response regulator
MKNLEKQIESLEQKLDLIIKHLIKEPIKNMSHAQNVEERRIDEFLSFLYGETVKSIADRKGINETTVRYDLEFVWRKLNLTIGIPFGVYHPKELWKHTESQKEIILEYLTKKG